ncbi:hypothetical protein ACJJTC_003486 [Scirpophaga incertulas]
MTVSVFLILVAFSTTAESKPAASYNFEHEVMPEQCVNSTYCSVKSEKYPQELIDSIIDRIIRDTPTPIFRQGGGDWEIGPVGTETDCEGIKDFDFIYEIVDNDGFVRYVVQSEKLQWKIETQICANPGPISASRSNLFTEVNVRENGLACEELRAEIEFLVLSFDGTTFDNVMVKNGLPMWCTTVMNNRNN